MELVRDAYVFQSGTAMKGDRLVTAGGRVLTVTAFGKDLEHAILSAQRSAALIDFEGRYLRPDIGIDLVKQPSTKAVPPVPR
jgi:phosphoribosylamine--glycine ligase